MDYLTFGQYARDEFVEKKSRFIGTGCPVTSEEEAKDFIDSIRAEFPDATHNVYAYILRNGTYRFSDDGEPGGTGGVPCFEVLQKSGLVDCCVVATRYFGGILLGAGGLVRAYSKTAKIAADACGTVRLIQCDLIKINLGYDAYKGLTMLCDSLGADVIETDFTDVVTVTVRIRESDSDRLIEAVTNLTGGKAIHEKTGKAFAPEK